MWFPAGVERMHWVRRSLRQGRSKVNRRAVLHLAVLVALVTILSVAYLMLVGGTAARGRHIQQLQAELFRLQRENEQLEVQIAAESAIVRLRERAKSLGFVPAERVVFVP